MDSPKPTDPRPSRRDLLERSLAALLVAPLAAGCADPAPACETGSPAEDTSDEPGETGVLDTSDSSETGDTGDTGLPDTGPITAPSAAAPAALEEIVDWIEGSDREALFQAAGEAIAGGVSWDDLTAAIQVAAVRVLPPHPVGWDLHPAFTVYPTCQLASGLPEPDRWVPIFWLLDALKDAQTSSAGDPLLGALDEASVSSPASALADLEAALDGWDGRAADGAVAGLFRAWPQAAVRDAMLLYGTRDLLNIGHQIIYPAQALRLMRRSGWRHAETVLRGMTWGFMEHADQRGELELFDIHRALAAKTDPAWQAAPTDDAAATELLQALRTADPAGAGEAALALVQSGVSPRSAWDGLMLRAAEMLLRGHDTGDQIVSLHAITGLNGFRVAFEEAGSPEVRLTALLQAAAFLPSLMGAEPNTDRTIDGLEPVEGASLDEVFQEAAGDRVYAAQLALGWLEAGGDPAQYLAYVRQLTALKAGGSHEVKFPMALIEEGLRIGDAARSRFLVAAALYGPAATDADWDGLADARAIIAGLCG